ncbi:MAG: IMPACT family protein [Defluviitaleaceae bacterium]|nr:IMPACT family protein [Defluviitaleaceae bacterium]
MTPYKLPLREAYAEFTEKKSCFIGYVSPVASEAEARAFVQSVRERHSEANHHVFAYRLKEGEIYRFNDDGEPSGTAGMPLLNTFLKQDIYDFCAVAVRYFGGIHLGAGGLTRAYSRSGIIALEAAGVGFMRELALCAVTVPYALYENAKRLLIASEATITAEDFSVEVTLEFSLIAQGLADLQAKITELTLGKVHITELGVRNAVGI